MTTPLADFLRAYTASGTARLHMPGHKGIIYQPSDLRWMAPIDVTELPGTGSSVTSMGAIHRRSEGW